MNAPQPTFADSRRSCLVGLTVCAGVVLFIPLKIALLILLFYVEEDWRGILTWEQAKADIAAEGETVDPEKFVPAPVPDDQNFGALPYFKVVSAPNEINDVKMKRFAIEETLKPFASNIAYAAGTSTSEGKLPFLGNWQKGQPPDTQDLAAKITAFIKLHPHGTANNPNASAFQVFEHASPEMAELRAAEPTHPQCLFSDTIEYQEPWKQSFGTDTSLLSIDKLLIYDAQLAMLDNQPDTALEDFRVGWKIAAGEQRRPFYVSELVAAGIMGLQLRVIQEELATHAWSDSQLAELQADLGKINFLAQGRWQINGEIACYRLPMIDFYATHRGKWSKDVSMLGTMFSDDNNFRESAFQTTYLLLPPGWFDLWKAHQARRKIEELRRIDLTSHRVNPSPDPEESSDPALHWLNLILPDVSLTKGMEKQIAYMQAQLDEAGIACRLERYHLAHQAYPFALTDLPADDDPLPHDIIGGQPYHYVMAAPEKYLLYSVGWNQTDDHGDAGSHPSNDSPDWVWTSYPNRK